MLYLRDQDVEPSRPRRDEMFQKNISRPPGDRDVQDRDYIPAKYPVLTQHNKQFPHGGWNEPEIEKLSNLYKFAIWPEPSFTG